MLAGPLLVQAPRRGEQQGAVALAALADSCLSEARPRCARLLTDVEAAAAGEMPLLQFGTDAQGERARSLGRGQTASVGIPLLPAFTRLLRSTSRWNHCCLRRGARSLGPPLFVGRDVLLHIEPCDIVCVDPLLFFCLALNSNLLKPPLFLDRGVLF